MRQVQSIDDVLLTLDRIIEESKEKESPLGYFAALYRKVTQKVKEGIENNYFEDGPRMEKLDVIFAKRYIDAYYQFEAHENPTKSWIKAFQLSQKYWPIVLQHLLIGMNAHINLDLGIAAAQVMKGKNIEDLKTDFNRINTILSSLVEEVEQDLSQIWPTLSKILKWTGKFDSLLIDFSMKIARDGAWEFALEYAQTPDNLKTEVAEARDKRVGEIAKLVSRPGWFVSLIFKIIRLGERGSISAKIQDMQD